MIAVNQKNHDLLLDDELLLCSRCKQSFLPDQVKSFCTGPKRIDCVALADYYVDHQLTVFILPYVESNHAMHPLLAYVLLIEQIPLDGAKKKILKHPKNIFDSVMNHYYSSQYVLGFTDLLKRHLVKKEMIIDLDMPYDYRIGIYDAQLFLRHLAKKQEKQQKE